MKKNFIETLFTLSSGLTIFDLFQKYTSSIPLMSNFLQLIAACVAIITSVFILKNSILKNKLLKQELSDKTTTKDTNQKKL